MLPAARRSHPCTNQGSRLMHPGACTHTHTHNMPFSRGMPGALAALITQPALLPCLWGKVAAVRQNVLIGKLMMHLPEPRTQLCCPAATASVLCQSSQNKTNKKKKQVQNKRVCGLVSITVRKITYTSKESLLPPLKIQ